MFRSKLVTPGCQYHSIQNNMIQCPPNISRSIFYMGVSREFEFLQKF